MEILRRNTDYAIRAMIHLAKIRAGANVPVQKIAHDEDISYELACKLLQTLKKKKLVKSTMGAKGGFSLGKQAHEISLYEIIETIQGPVCMNKCFINLKSCKQNKSCPVRKKLKKLQNKLRDELADITLSDILKA